MPRLPLASAILAMALATQGQAQQDQEAQRLIQQLSPTRGIRMPSADPGTAVSSPSLTPAAPEASPALSSTGGLASPPNQTFVPQPLTTAPMEPAAPAPPPAAPPPRQTTAPTGVAAVSIGFLVPSILHFKMTPEVNYKCWQPRGLARKWASCKVFGRSWFVLCLGVLAMFFTLVSMVDHMTAGGGHGSGLGEDAFDPTIEYDQYGIPIVNANGVTSGHGSINTDSSGTGSLSLN